MNANPDHDRIIEQVSKACEVPAWWVEIVVGVDVGFDDTASIVVASRASDGTVTIHDVEVSKAAAISVAAVAASLRRSIDARTT